MLSYITKKVNKAYKASKKALTSNPAYKETPQYKLVRALQKNQSQILPNEKLLQLATMTYESQKFYLILDIIMLRMDTTNQIFDFQSSKGLMEVRNCFVVCAYLVRNGASGFIDQFRENIEGFKKFGWFLDSLFSGTQDKSARYKNMLNQVSNRLKHFIQLLEDNKRLLKQKQISMLIKKKLKMNQKQNQLNKSNTQQEEHKENKKNKNIDNFLNNYLWKYVSMIDDRIDYVAEVLADKLQKYLLEEAPESFQIDEVEVNQQVKMKTQGNFSEIKIKEEQQFLQKKLKIKKEVKNQDLLS